MSRLWKAPYIFKCGLQLDKTKAIATDQFWNIQIIIIHMLQSAQAVQCLVQWATPMKADISSGHLDQFQNQAMVQWSGLCGGRLLG
jgi:hypothetical protein